MTQKTTTLLTESIFPVTSPVSFISQSFIYDFVCFICFFETTNMEKEVDTVTKQLRGKLRVTVAKEVWKDFMGDFKWAVILKPTTTKSSK